MFLIDNATLAEWSKAIVLSSLKILNHGRNHTIIERCVSSNLTGSNTI